MTLCLAQRFGMQSRGRIDLFRRVRGGGHVIFSLIAIIGFLILEL